MFFSMFSPSCPYDNCQQDRFVGGRWGPLLVDIYYPTPYASLRGVGYGPRRTERYGRQVNKVPRRLHGTNNLPMLLVKQLKVAAVWLPGECGFVVLTLARLFVSFLVFCLYQYINNMMQYIYYLGFGLSTASLPGGGTTQLQCYK